MRKLISLITENELSEHNGERIRALLNKIIINSANDIYNQQILYVDTCSMSDLDLLILEKGRVPVQSKITKYNLNEYTSRYSILVGEFYTVDFNAINIKNFKIDDVSSSLHNDFNDSSDNALLFKFDLNILHSKLKNEHLFSRYSFFSKKIKEFRSLLSENINIKKFKTNVTAIEYNGEFRDFCDMSFYIEHDGSHYIQIRLQIDDFLTPTFFNDLNEAFKNIFLIEWDFTSYCLEQYLENLSLLSY